MDNWHTTTYSREQPDRQRELYETHSGGSAVWFIVGGLVLALVVLIYFSSSGAPDGTAPAALDNGGATATQAPAATEEPAALAPATDATSTEAPATTTAPADGGAATEGGGATTGN